MRGAYGDGVEAEKAVLTSEKKRREGREREVMGLGSGHWDSASYPTYY